MCVMLAMAVSACGAEGPVRADPAASSSDSVLPDQGTLERLGRLDPRAFRAAMDAFHDAGGYRYDTLRDRTYYAEIDSRMDDLRRDQFTRMLAEGSTISIEGAVDVALLGRYFERFADHAVAVGRRVIYIITGEVPEGEDWPNA